MAATKSILVNRREMRRGSSHFMSIYNFFHSIAFSYSVIWRIIVRIGRRVERSVCVGGEGLGNPQVRTDTPDLLQP